MSDSQTCSNCGKTVPSGEFCAACGAGLRERKHAAERPYAFVANPGEHVFQPAVTSAIFPHLPQQRSAPFRLALLVVATGSRRAWLPPAHRAVCRGERPLRFPSFTVSISMKLKSTKMSRSTPLA